VPNAQQIIDTAGRLESARSSFLSLWESVSRYCSPDLGTLTAPDSPGSETAPPVNSHGQWASDTMAAGLFANAVSSGRPWFALRHQDDALNQDDTVKRWMGQTSKTLLRTIQGSNWTLELFELLKTMCALGTAVLYEELDSRGRLTFRQIPLRECSLAEDASGRVDTVYRRFRLSPRQAVEKYGSEVSPQTAAAAADHTKADTEDVEFIHAVYPRRDTEPRQDPLAKEMPWASITVEVERKKVVAESGYSSFPFQVPRFYRRAGEVYGRAPSMLLLPELRGLQRETADARDAVEYLMLPPILVPGGSSYVINKLTPGTVAEYDAALGPPVPYETRANPEAGMAMVEKTEGAITRGYQADRFSALTDRKNMSATEVVERVNEQTLNLTPVVSRLQSELFAPMIERLLALSAEAGRLEPPPESMAAAPAYDILYTSRLDARLAQVEIESILAGVEAVGRLAQACAASPDLPRVLNVPKTTRHILMSSGTPVELLYTEQEEADMLAAAQQQAAQEREAAQMQAAVRPVDPMKAPESGSVGDIIMQRANAVGSNWGGA
jgi:hypothetical protein